MFSAENLRAERGGRILFDKLSFELKEGELLLLSGENGCGKTSLLRILSGLMSPTEGKVVFEEKPIREHELYRQMMLFIGHDNAIKPELSVYDNLQYWAALRGTEMLVPAAMQYFGLMPLGAMPVGSLSAGWQRRVALARLLSMPSLIWLLDEPATNLDDEGQKMVEALIETRLKQGGIVILSSHHKPKDDVKNILNLSDYKPSAEALAAELAE